MHLHGGFMMRLDFVTWRSGPVITGVLAALLMLL